MDLVTLSQALAALGFLLGLLYWAALGFALLMLYASDGLRALLDPRVLVILLAGPASVLPAVAVSDRRPRAGAVMLMAGGAAAGLASLFGNMLVAVVWIAVTGPMLTLGTLFFMFVRPRNLPDDPAV